MRRELIIVASAMMLVACGGSKTDNKPFNKWVSRVLEYKPAPGGFINTSSGNPKAAQSIIGGRQGLVSLGGFGGYVVFGFDHRVANILGPDFVIHGNAFSGSSEPGIVMVSQDINGNGLADDPWYEFQGTSHRTSTPSYTIIYTPPTDTTKAQDVVWTDNLGTSGTVQPTDFHKQCIFPLFIDGAKRLSFSGRLLTRRNIISTDGIVTLANLSDGYADNFSDDYPVILFEDSDTKFSNKFDISQLFDSQDKPVVLDYIDFIKVYNCMNEQNGPIGESSTEICGAISLTNHK